MSKKLEMVLNINTGVVVPRTPATDENPIIFRRIDEETGRMINEKKVDPFAVVEAIEKQERSGADFNWREYDKKRREAEKLLNVSKREMTPVVEEMNDETTTSAKDAKVLSLKDLGLTTTGEQPKAAKATKGKAKEAAATTVETTVSSATGGVINY